MVGYLLTTSRLTMHNVHHLLSLMKAARNAIIEDRFAFFVHNFFARYYKGKPVPSWATDALAVVGINLNQYAAEPLPD
jgi:queuine tRNA-ribosyltransferase catalytic subunit